MVIHVGKYTIYLYIYMYGSYGGWSDDFPFRKGPVTLNYIWFCRNGTLLNWPNLVVSPPSTFTTMYKWYVVSGIYTRQEVTYTAPINVTNYWN